MNIRKYIQKWKEEKATENIRQEEEQQRRKERLQELEEAKKRKEFHIPNPIRAMKENKEIKELKREITAFEEKKKERRGVLAAVGIFAVLFVVLFGVIGIMANVEKNEAADEFTAEISAANIAAMKTEETEETENIEETENTEDLGLSVQSSSEEMSEEIVEETESEGIGIPELLASDLKVKYQTDYSHKDNDAIVLGNEEGVTITVSVPTGTVWDAIVIYGDEKLLDIDYQDVEGEDSGFDIYVTGKEVCNTELVIMTAYELAVKGEEAGGYILNIQKLDSTAGKIVYITPTGEKYHFSGKCAGENAIKTTYRDASAYEYEPCRKCAN